MGLQMSAFGGGDRGAADLIQQFIGEARTKEELEGVVRLGAQYLKKKYGVSLKSIFKSGASKSSGRKRRRSRRGRRGRRRDIFEIDDLTVGPVADESVLVYDEDDGLEFEIEQF